jgi:glycosyltransferase involved in cell wall biosynthesis
MIGAQETGNETYVAGLAAALARSPSVECIAAIQPGTRLPAYWAKDQPIVKKLYPPGHWWRLTYALPKICWAWKADILHVTYTAPLSSPCPIVVTLHDVAFKRFPRFFSARDHLLFGTLLPLTLRRASAIITGSESSAADIVTFFPYTAGKVHVVPLAPAPIFQPLSSSDHYHFVGVRYGIVSRFIMAVGNLQPRKNLNTIVRAFRLLLADGVEDYQLVLVGQDAFRSSQFRAQVRDLIKADKLILTGYVPEADLPVFYNMATLFVYLSFYEGFGLPILEAMACGTPVLCSSTSSLPEVAGDAAILANPHDIERLAQILKSALADTDFLFSLREKGLRRAAQFSWDKTASHTIMVYKRALEQWHKKNKT